MRPRTDALSHLLVGLQFTAIGLCALPLGGAPGGPWWSLSLSLLGVLFGIYTLVHNRPGNFGIYPEPKAGCCLVTTGPYRWVRHPMYTSLLLTMLGIALFNGVWVNLLGLGLLLAAILGKTSREERYLRRLFPEYDTYARRTRRLIPLLF